jgi:Protein of unknown function (DUF3306)
MKTDEQAPDGFLSRWARRKDQARSGAAIAPEAPPPLPAAVPVEAVVAPAVAIEEAPNAEPAPTLADVALLTRESDYSRFVGAGVDDGVKQAAMKKLFTDPHFNVMDGLDTYIDDYGKPDPIPLAMLRRMTQSKFLRLFDDDDEEADEAKQLAASSNEKAPPDATLTAPDDHADLRLQQDDAARRPGADQGAGA